MSIEGEDIGYQPEFLKFNDPEADGGFMCIRIPFSDLRHEWLPEDSIYEDLFKFGGIGRLQDVRQLSLLSFVGPTPESQYFLEFSHTRLDHTLSVTKLVEKILRSNGLTDREVYLGMIAAGLHDSRDPALGDATMKVDPINLSEEESFLPTVTEKEKELFAKYHTSAEEVSDIIKNKGILGEVLDIADRLEYTTADLDAVLNDHMFMSDASSHASNHQYFLALEKILDKDPKFGNLYKNVRIDQKNNQVFFNDPDRLAQFLYIRAYLHQKMYLHPISQGRDMLITNLIAKHYSATGEEGKVLTPELLRSIGDYQLEDILSELYGYKREVGKNRVFLQAVTDWYPEYKGFSGKNAPIELLNEVDALIRNGMTIIGVRERRKFNPGTGYLVLDPVTNTTKPFSEYDPEFSKILEGMSDEMKGTFVYYKDLKKVHNPVTRDLIMQASI